MASSVAAVGGGSGSVPASPLWAWLFIFLRVACWLASERAGGSGRVVVEERGLGKLTRSCGRENY
jgi:hypothetical protein